MTTDKLEHVESGLDTVLSTVEGRKWYYNTMLEAGLFSSHPGEFPAGQRDIAIRMYEQVVDYNPDVWVNMQKEHIARTQETKLKKEK